MSYSRPYSLARTIGTGNVDVPFQSQFGVNLPSEDALKDRLDAFFKDRGGVAGLPAPMRSDITWLMEQLYGNNLPIQPRAVVVGSTESVILADGSRPVAFVEQDRLMLKGKPDGPFVEVLSANQTYLEQASLSVGRIETDEFAAPEGVDVYYDGSAYLIAHDLVMTNRHVIERMVYEPTTDGPFTLKAKYWVNFDGQFNGSGHRRVAITKIEYVSSGHIGSGGDMSLLDMAILRLGAAEDTGFVQPAPLPLTGRRLPKETKVAVIGFPAPAQIFTGTGTPPDGFELETVLRTVFDERFGYKRCASGRVSTPVGASALDPKKWVFAHDASTLGGNSGSPVLPLDRGLIEVAALHFLGSPRKANYAYVFDQLSEILSPLGVAIGQ